MQDSIKNKIITLLKVEIICAVSITLFHFIIFILFKQPYFAKDGGSIVIPLSYLCGFLGVLIVEPVRRKIGNPIFIFLVIFLSVNLCLDFLFIFHGNNFAIESILDNLARGFFIGLSLLPIYAVPLGLAGFAFWYLLRKTNSH
jgi:hypothetical protein